MRLNVNWISYDFAVDHSWWSVRLGIASSTTTTLCDELLSENRQVLRFGGYCFSNIDSVLELATRSTFVVILLFMFTVSKGLREPRLLELLALVQRNLNLAIWNVFDKIQMFYEANLLDLSVVFWETLGWGLPRSCDGQVYRAYQWKCKTLLHIIISEIHWDTPRELLNRVWMTCGLTSLA